MHIVRSKFKAKSGKIYAKIKQLHLKAWLSISTQDRVLIINIDDHELIEESRLDGCYVIKTDLAKSHASAQKIHERYKDLAMVESAFRTVKSDLDIRPVYVRKEENTRGHVLVVMLAYRARKKITSQFFLNVRDCLS